MANKSQKVRTNLGAYQYECPDISAAGIAYRDWSNGRPVTTCTKVSYSDGVNPKWGSLIEQIMGK